MTTTLFMLRYVQLGISIRDLELHTIGLVNDMFSESVQYEKKFATMASQDGSVLKFQTTVLILFAK